MKAPIDQTHATNRRNRLKTPTHTTRQNANIQAPTHPRTMQATTTITTTTKTGRPVEATRQHPIHDHNPAKFLRHLTQRPAHPTPRMPLAAATDPSSTPISPNTNSNWPHTTCTIHPPPPHRQHPRHL